MGCVSSNTKEDKDNAIAKQIVDITWKEYDKDGNDVLDMNEVRNYVHANVKLLN